MNISMVGIDHNRASVDVRAQFAFTKKSAGEALAVLKEKPGILGCTLISTCNRLELWASTESEEVPIFEYLCELKEVCPEDWKEYFIFRKDQEAVSHLFYLTAGLKSQIMGEDQIITQVKTALNIAREQFTSDSVMEVLFRMAVTAGKKIKTEIPFSHGNTSVIHQAVQKLQSEGYDFKGKTCMVIGNGEMGKLSAETLMDAGADVTVTVRQYKSGIVDIPRNCKRLSYADRMDYVPNCDLVVSATASPNVTLRAEQFRELHLDHPVMLIDLAVPRDIDPEIGSIDGFTLYDMDSFGTIGTPEEQRTQLEAAAVIVKEQMDEFYDWLESKDVVPRIQGIRDEVTEDLQKRIQKIFHKEICDEGEREKLLQTVDTAASKVATKLMFGLRDQLTPDMFLKCIEGLEKIYEE